MIGVQVEPAMVPMCRLSRAWAEEELCEHMGLPVPSEQVQGRQAGGSTRSKGGGEHGGEVKGG